jgi:hypothetical protein
MVDAKVATLVSYPTRFFVSMSTMFCCASTLTLISSSSFYNLVFSPAVMVGLEVSYEISFNLIEIIL